MPRSSMLLRVVLWSRGPVTGAAFSPGWWSFNAGHSTLVIQRWSSLIPQGSAVTLDDALRQPSVVARACASFGCRRALRRPIDGTSLSRLPFHDRLEHDHRC